MPRTTVGLLAALGAIISALVSLVHGDLVPLMVLCAGASTGLAAYMALPSKKKSPPESHLVIHKHARRVRRRLRPFPDPPRRRGARSRACLGATTDS